MRVPFLEKQLRKLLRAAQTIMTSLDGRGDCVRVGQASASVTLATEHAAAGLGSGLRWQMDVPRCRGL